MTIFGNFDFPPYGSPLPKDLYCPVGLCTVLFGLSPLLFLIALALGAFLPTFMFFSQFSSFLQYSVLVSCTNDMVAWHLFWAIIFAKKMDLTCLMGFWIWLYLWPNVYDVKIDYAPPQIERYFWIQEIDTRGLKWIKSTTGWVNFHSIIFWITKIFPYLKNFINPNKTFYR